MPMRLFRFSRFFRTRKAGSSVAAIISLVVVLPQLPVMPTTGTRNRPRQAWARSPRAVRASRTAMTVTSAGAAVQGRVLKPGPYPAALRYPFLHQHPPGAPAQGGGDEFVAVVVLPGEGDEELPGLAGAGVGADAAERVPGALVHQGPAGGGQNFGSGEGGAHQPWYSARACATSSRSSKWRRSAPQI